jgi:ribosomal protein L33
MLTFSIIAVALANTTADPTAIYVIIGVIVLFLIVAASSETAAKKVVKKYYCPHCHRQINFTAPVIKPIQHYPRPARGQEHNSRLSNQLKNIYSRQNAPVQQRGGKKYCPYCKKQILGS